MRSRDYTRSIQRMYTVGRAFRSMHHPHREVDQDAIAELASTPSRGGQSDGMGPRSGPGVAFYPVATTSIKGFMNSHRTGRGLVSVRAIGWDTRGRFHPLKVKLRPALLLPCRPVGYTARSKTRASSATRFLVTHPPSFPPP